MVVESTTSSSRIGARLDQAVTGGCYGICGHWWAVRPGRTSENLRLGTFLDFRPGPFCKGVGGLRAECITYSCSME